MKYTIDAANQKLGRVASRAAVLLMGKNKPDFKKNSVPEVTVEIINTAKADLSEKKRQTFKYTRYSGYPGGIRSLSMNDLIAQKGHAFLFKTAIAGMLPKNKLHKQMMKHLKIND